MSEERLERIKRESKGVVWNTETDEDLLTELDTPDFNWLIEQAERVDELERKNYDLREDLAGRHSTVEELNEKIDKLWIQNKCYREAIQEAMELNHDENFNYDVDKVLLKALESESHED